MNSTRDAAGHVHVLVVSPFDSDHTSLAHIFGHTAWSFDKARSLKEAMAKLADQPSPVILCEETLPDGSWKDLLALCQCASESGLPHRYLAVCRRPPLGGSPEPRGVRCARQTFPIERSFSCHRPRLAALDGLPQVREPRLFSKCRVNCWSGRIT